MQCRWAASIEKEIYSMRTVLSACCVLLAAFTGCAGSVNNDEAIARVNSTNIQRLSNLYFSYQTKNEWHGPVGEPEFKGFIRSYNPQKLARIGVDPQAVDALFTSERDGQPFKIRYSVQGSAMGSSEPVVFESVGVDGKRQVGFLNMTHAEFDPAEYESLWARGTPSTDLVRGN
jgi:hypothetical protein